MQAVILAAGLGTRLRPLTNTIPKPMVLVNGKPFLEYQIRLLKKNGFNNIVICLGYLGQVIKDYFKNGENFGVKISYSTEKDHLNPSGTGGALKNAQSLLDKEFLLLYGDSFLDIDYKSLISYFWQKQKKGIVVAYENQPKIIQNNIEVAQNNEIVSYNKKEEGTANCVEAGVLIFKKEIVGLIPENTFFSLEEQLFDILIKDKELFAFVTNKRFYDIGTFEGLKVFSDLNLDIKV